MTDGIKSPNLDELVLAHTEPMHKFIQKTLHEDQYTVTKQQIIVRCKDLTTAFMLGKLFQQFLYNQKFG